MEYTSPQPTIDARLTLKDGTVLKNGYSRLEPVTPAFAEWIKQKNLPRDKNTKHSEDIAYLVDNRIVHTLARMIMAAGFTLESYLLINLGLD